MSYIISRSLIIFNVILKRKRKKKRKEKEISKKRSKVVEYIYIFLRDLFAKDLFHNF